MAHHERVEAFGSHHPMRRRSVHPSVLQENLAQCVRSGATLCLLKSWNRSTMSDELADDPLIEELLRRANRRFHGRRITQTHRLSPLQQGLLRQIYHQLQSTRMDPLSQHADIESSQGDADAIEPL